LGKGGNKEGKKINLSSSRPPAEKNLPRLKKRATGDHTGVDLSPRDTKKEEGRIPLCSQGSLISSRPREKKAGPTLPHPEEKKKKKKPVLATRPGKKKGTVSPPRPENPGGGKKGRINLLVTAEKKVKEKRKNGYRLPPDGPERKDRNCRF